jgi:hypothetical protein
LGGTHGGATGIESQVTDGASKLYQKTLEVYEQTSDFFQQFEGGRDALIRTNSDVSKGAGQRVTIRSLAGFYGEPKEGDSLFEESADFEEFVMNDYQLDVDYIRWATRMTERSEEFMGLRGELKSGLPREAGQWLGRIKTERMLMELRDRSTSDNQINAGGKDIKIGVAATGCTLASANTLSYDEVIAASTKLKTQGGEPAVVKTQGKNRIQGYVCVATTDSLFSLETDDTYVANLRTGGSRGNGNLLFAGGWADIRGNIICEMPTVDHDGRGPIGSPLNPKAIVGEAVTLTATGGTLKFGGSAAGAANTAAQYTKWFPGHDYKYGEGDVGTPTSTHHYLLIINPPNGANPNKWCVAKYAAGNNGNQIVCTESTHTGSTTVGSVNPASAPWSGNTTNAIQVGATVLPCTSDGVPFADTLFMSKGAAIRGYGKHRNKRGVVSHEDGFVQDIFVRSVFGQSIREDASGRKPGVVRLRHAINYAGIHLPTIS